MKELAEVKSSVLQLHKGAEKRLEAFIQVAMCSFTFVLPLMSRSSHFIDAIVTIFAGRAQRMGPNAGQPEP